MSEPAQADLVTSLALVAERSAAGTTPMKKPRIGLFQPWSGSMDEGWPSGLVEQSEFDVVILADDARLPIEGGGGGAAACGGPAGGTPCGTAPIAPRMPASPRAPAG